MAFSSVRENVTETLSCNCVGKSLWQKKIFSSVYGEKRPLCHIGILKQNEKSTQYIRVRPLSFVVVWYPMSMIS